MIEDFPGGPVVKNPPASAWHMSWSLVWEDSIPCEATKPNAPQWPTPHLGPVCCKKSHHNEKPVHHSREERLLTPTRESPRVAVKTQDSQNKKEEQYKV